MDQINRAITSKVIDVSAFDQDQMKKVSEEIKFQIQNFLRPLSHRLWIDSFGDIRTGNYIIRRCTMSVTGAMTTLYRAMTSNLEPISRHVSLDYAKLACEIHARKMLGWEV